MYHVERDMPMTEQLNAWALNISHDFLEYHDVNFLTINTTKHSNGVNKAIENSNESPPTDQAWIPVPEKKKQPTQPPHSNDDPPVKTGGILREPAKTNKTKPRPQQQTPRESENSNERNSRKVKANTTPGSNSPSAATVVEEEAMEIDETSNASTKTKHTTANIQPEIQETIAPHPHVSTNDGTHRITGRQMEPTDRTHRIRE